MVIAVLDGFLELSLGQHAVLEVRNDDGGYDFSIIKDMYYKKIDDLKSGSKKKAEEEAKTLKDLLSKLKTLTLQNESKDLKIKDLNDKLSEFSDIKGNEFLQTLNNLEGDVDKKTKQAYLDEISDKSEEILKLKEKLTEQNDEIQALKQAVDTSDNPFGTSGGSDDEGNKGRVSRTSVDGKKSSLIPKNRLSKIERENEEIEELTKLLNIEHEKVKNLTDELEDIKLEFEESKAKSRKMLVDKEKVIEKLKNVKNIDGSEPDDDVMSQGSSKSKASKADSFVDPLTGMFNAMNDQCTIDYLRNVFVKYLVYIAKKPKKAETCEALLYTLLNITDEQKTMINRARKKSNFWTWVKNMRNQNNKNIDMADLDMNLNFTMTDIGNSSYMTGMDAFYGGGILESVNTLSGDLEMTNSKVKKKSKKVKKKAKTSTKIADQVIQEAPSNNEATPEKPKA